MSALLTQNGGVSLAFLLMAFAACGAVSFGPLKERKTSRNIPYRTIAFGMMAVTAVVAIILVVDFFVIGAFDEAPSFIVNLVAVALMACMVIASIAVSVLLRGTQEHDRKLHATTVLVLVPVFGFVASTMWLYADAAGHHPVLDYLARVFAGAFIVLLVPMALAVAIAAHDYAVRMSTENKLVAMPQSGDPGMRTGNAG